MSDVRGLYRPGDGPVPHTNVVPKAATKETAAVRKNIGDFLEANLPRPLWADDAQADQRIEDALNTMTLNERITIEIEMQQRNAAVHSFDYDPF